MPFMPSPSLFRRPSAFVPVLMSTAAASLVVEYLIRVGRVRQADEGTEAHLFQLLLAAQVPLIAYFAVTYLPRQPRHSLVVMALQLVAGLAALSLVYYLEH
jgi:hypothetical protein